MSTPERQEREGGKGAARRSRIPRFKNLEEAAAFWDTHDSADFEDEFEEVKEPVRFVVRRTAATKAITVRMDEDTHDHLTREAAEQGIGPSTLVRMLILEHIRKAEQSPRP